MTSENDPSSGPTRTIGVVIPAYKAEADLPVCLNALEAAGFPWDDIFVVDDASPDRTVAVAEGYGVAVVKMAANAGPAAARNAGVNACERDVIAFVDADVCVHPDVRERLMAWFSKNGPAAVFGSYDAKPPQEGIVARYRNLLHHHVHQTSNEVARSFWTGLGAVRRDAFVDVGGFDPAPRWRSIEDVEFGARLHRKGYEIRLDKELLGTHLKAWTLRSMWRTDLFYRAIPYTRLSLFRGNLGGDLNLGWKHKASALCVLGAIAALIVGFLAPYAWIAVPFLVVCFVALNWPLLTLLKRVGGVRFAAASMFPHALHYIAAAVGYGYVTLFEYAPKRLLRNAPG